MQEEETEELELELGSELKSLGEVPSPRDIRQMASVEVRRSLDLLHREERSKFTWQRLAGFCRMRALGLSQAQAASGLGFWSKKTWALWKQDPVHGDFLDELEHGSRAIGSARYAQRLCELGVTSTDDRVRATVTTFMLERLSPGHMQKGGEDADSTAHAEDLAITVRVEGMDGVVLPPGLQEQANEEAEKEDS